MVERKYDSRTTRPVEISAQEQVNSPEGVSDVTLYEVPRCLHYDAIFGKGRFSAGEMIAKARNFV